MSHLLTKSYQFCSRVGTGLLSWPGQIVGLLLLLSVHIGLLAVAASVHSPTALEPASLVAGLSHWKFGRFELFRVNPPMVRMIAAAPVLLAGYDLDWNDENALLSPRTEFPLGNQFVAANGDRSLFLFKIARWACLSFSVLGAVTAYRWANELYGAPSGLLAATMWCFEPTILGHAELITTDCAAASVGLFGSYTFWRWLKFRTFVSSSIAGLAMGLTLLTKMTWIILLGLWPVLWTFWMLTSRPLNQQQQRWRMGLVQLAWLTVLGLYVLNLGYLFDQPFKSLGDFAFVSDKMTNRPLNPESRNRFYGSILGRIPVPLPEQYVLGADLQYRDFEKFGPPSYLGGRWQEHGWWYYYLYGMLVKQTHGAQLLAAIALFSLGFRFDSTRFRDEIILAVPFCVLFCAVSAQLEFNHHFRYVLPSLGALAVFSARVTGVVLACRQKWARALLATCVVSLTTYSVAAVVQAYPNTLRYFNPGSGGLMAGHHHLLHSSLDWGQDNRILLTLWSKMPALRGAPTHLVGAYIPGVAKELTQASDISRPDGQYEIWSKVVYLEQNRTAVLPPNVVFDGGAIFVTRID